MPIDQVGTARSNEPNPNRGSVRPGCLATSHSNSALGGVESQDIGKGCPASSARHRGSGRAALAGVQSPCDHHCCHSRRPFPGAGRTRLQRLPSVGVAAGRPLPSRGRRRVRTTLAPARHTPASNAISDGRVDPQTPPRTCRQGTRRGRGHDPLAPPTPPPDSGVASHDLPHHPPRQPGHTCPGEATQVVLHPLPSRATQRNLASRLHPLDPRRWQRRRDPHLAR